MKFMRSIVVKLRDYQQEAFDKVIASDEHTLVVSPCGSGKSLIMSELVNYFSNNGKKVLFVVHRNNLLDQFNNHLKRYDNLNCDVLSPLRALNSNKDYDIIFIDETHHATSKSFQNVFNKFDQARRIGFTATPIRLSGERLAKPINQFRSAPFDEVINTISINELIHRGYLSPFDVKAGDWTLYFDNRTIKTVAGEFSSKSISEAFKTDKLKELVENFKELAEDRKTIAYTSSIKMAEQLAEELNNQGIVAKAFHSKLSAQQVDDYIEQFKNNQIKVCVNVDLFGEGFDVPEINMNAYMKARALTQEFIDEWLGYFINPSNKIMSSLLLGCGLPGGMMGSMMADLGGIRQTINNLRKKKGEEELSMDDMLVKLFNEVEYVWPRVGYPPLVTPFSQYTKNIALMNLLTMEQGKGRFVMMDESMWGMILGKSGKVPGKIDPVLVELAKKQGREFTDVDPRTLLTDALEDFKKEMDENGWDYGQDDEELFELAMHPEQYRNYKSGQAKKNFLEDLQKAKDAKLGAKVSLEEATAFKHAMADAIVSPVKGQIFWEFQGDGEAAPAVEPFIGKEYKEGDTFCYICTSWGEFEAIPAALGGKLVEIKAKQGDKVNKGDVIAYIQRPTAE